MSLASPGAIQVFYAEYTHEYKPYWIEEEHRLQKIQEAFRAGGGRHIVTQLISENGLDEEPLVTLADILGISQSQVCRLRNGGSSSIGVLLLLIVSRKLKMPVWSHAAFSANGLVEAVKLATYLEQTTNLRSNRVPKPKLEMPLLDAFWLTSLMAGNLYDPWNYLAKKYHQDIREAWDKTEFRELSTRLTASFFEKIDTVPELKEAGERYQSTGSQSVAALCLDVDRAWRRIHKLPLSKTTLQNAWDAIEMMTPWCG